MMTNPDKTCPNLSTNEAESNNVYKPITPLCNNDNFFDYSVQLAAINAACKQLQQWWPSTTKPINQDPNTIVDITLDNNAKQNQWSHHLPLTIDSKCLHHTTAAIAWLDYNDKWPWQESHEIKHKPCELLVLFSSCGTLSTGSRMDDQPLPRQTIPEPHKFTMTSFTSTTFHSPNDGSHLQQNQATSSLKDHIIIKSSSRGLQWDFCW